MKSDYALQYPEDYYNEPLLAPCRNNEVCGNMILAGTDYDEGFCDECRIRFNEEHK